ncbi:MAG: aminodeoxychorismate lyase [Gammaproteobacteria bacterium]|nr:aminodeoxychorismate lyase [Gammaproteobacteria bacterium]
MSRWLCNGVPTDVTSIDERAFQYGDGLFETIAVRDGRPRFWNMHIDRLARGCERLRLTMPRHKVLRGWLNDAIAASNEDTAFCTAKLILTGGAAARGYAREMPTKVTTYCGIYASEPLPRSHYFNGVSTLVCNTRLALFSVTAGCKTLNRLEQVLARSEFAADGTFEGLTLDADDRLICGTISNVFIVENGSISTPSLERCGVEGVMRRHVIEVLESSDLPVSVRDIGVSELLSCDEVFLTNSQFGVLPVRRCGEKSWQEHLATGKVMSIVSVNNVAECAQ